jgi:hypothetical protein
VSDPRRQNEARTTFGGSVTDGKRREKYAKKVESVHLSKKLKNKEEK